MLGVPDLMAVYQQGVIDLEGVKAVQLAMIAHCELMGDRVAILDAPPGLNAQQVKEWRVDKAGYDSKYAALYWPWIKVFDPLSGQAIVRAAERPHGRHLGAQRRHARRAQGAGQRGHPRRDLRSSSTSPRASTTSSTRSASTASARSPAGASASGAPARCRATRRGATSTSAGCSTTSRSRSSRAPSGWSSSRTTSDLWERVKRTINAFLLRRLARRRAVRRDARARRSTSSATPRPTRPRSSTPASSSSRSASRR